ncbi:MAG TPA: hypothetical protein G4O10_10065 [Dehalococcoidia bacterium]|nr:hypothetical protein [Dehalococcoidia bacterium]
MNYEKGVVDIKGKRLETRIGTATAPINYPAPLRARRIIGDVIQSLRKALDYLVYELARYDSKSVVEKTQFVIVDSEKDFKRQKWHLRGLTGEHIAMLERLQPYNGCNWTKLIETLSNPDKHKTLTAIRHYTGIRLDGSHENVIISGKKVDVDSYATIKITFNDGTPVIEGLEQLVLDVTNTLKLFNSEFK